MCAHAQIEVEVEQAPVQYVTKVQQVPVQQAPVQYQTLQTMPTSSYQVRYSGLLEHGGNLAYSCRATQYVL